MYKKKLPQQESTQSMKFIIVVGPSFINNLVFDQSEKTKKAFSLCRDNIPSSKAMLFLTFQTDQNKHRGATFHTLLRFLPIQAPSHPTRVSLTEEGNTQHTPNKVKNRFHIVLVFSQMEKKMVNRLFIISA